MRGGRNGHVGLVFESRLTGPTPKGVGSRFFQRGAATCRRHTEQLPRGHCTDGLSKSSDRRGVGLVR